MGMEADLGRSHDRMESAVPSPQQLAERMIGVECTKWHEKNLNHHQRLPWVCHFCVGKAS